MSTNVLQIPNIKGAIVLFSGMYLFFVSLIFSPFVNFSLFYSPEVTTKLFLVTSTAVIAILQLLFYVPSLPRGIFSALPKFVKSAFYALLIIGLGSLLFANYPSVVLFGIYSMWEHNLMIGIVYVILFIAWYVYFHLLTHLQLQHLLFNSLLSLLIATVILYSLGSYYVWHIDSDYTSNAVARLSLSFRNPLLAAYFIGMLANYQFARTLLSLVQDKHSRSTFLHTVFQLLLYVGIAYALLLTFTRSAWIASSVVAGLTFLGVVWIKRTSKSTELSIGRIAIAGLILFVSLAPFVSLHKKAILQRNSDLIMESQQTLSAVADTVGNAADTEKALRDFYQQSTNYSSAQIRLLEWEWGIRTALSTPRNFLFGAGADNAYFEMPKYRNAEFNNIPIDSGVKPFYVRNIVVTYLVEHGIIATILLSVLIAWGIYAVLASIAKLTSSTEQKLSLLPAISIIFAYLAQGMFYYSTVVPTVLLLFALSFTLTQITNFDKISLRLPTGTEKVFLLLTAFALTVWLTLIIKTERILSLYRISPLPPAQEIVEKNARLPINNNALKRYLVLIYPGRESARKYMAKMMNSKDPDDLRVTSDALYKLAKDYDDEQALKDSIKTTERLLMLTPTYPVPWDERGLRYLYYGNFTEARTSFLKAIELKEDYWYAYMHMGEVSRQQCNPTEALEWYNKAERYIPSAQVEINEAKAEIEHPREECLTQK